MATLIVTLEDQEIKRLPVTKVESTIGRQPTCDLCIDSPAISRHHATIQFTGQSWTVRDEGSANGVFVHGEKVTTANLADRTPIQLGKFLITFYQGGGLSPDPERTRSEDRGPCGRDRRYTGPDL